MSLRITCTECGEMNRIENTNQWICHTLKHTVEVDGYDN